MSVAIPVVAAAFGSVTPPQEDILELQVHLGCTKRGFELRLPSPEF